MNEFSQFYVDLFTYLFEDFLSFVEAFWVIVYVNTKDNIISYFNLLKSNFDYFTPVSWIMVIITTILNLALIVFLVAKIVLWVKKYAAFRTIEIEKNELIEEIASLNDKVVNLVDEKNQILAMKVSQLGINASTGQPAEKIIASPMGSRAYAQPGMGFAAGPAAVIVGSQRQDNSNQPERPDTNLGPSRFVKLISVDKEYAGKDTHIYMEEADLITLPDMVTRFVNFAASQLKLYYTPKMISLFFSGMASTKVMILEGISGTGKTSLPYAMAKFFKNSANIISVQPSWRDRAEILGYLNEFTKRFNETEFLKAVYESSYRKDINFIVLDEMNLARIEYYFAEFLSIMEMPDSTEWKIDLVPDPKGNDPIKVINGKLQIPNNLWFVGTANKDDSTFTITDKVYDRAFALEFEAKGEFFQAPDTQPISMSYTYLHEMFDEAFYKYPVSRGLIDRFAILDKYVQQNFKIAFGNRIMVQMSKFIPVYVACGGSEEDGLDYIFAYKVLRKFESLNLSFLRNEMDTLVVQIQKIFGKNSFNESIKLIRNLQKMI
jgi:hypothetical protein